MAVDRGRRSGERCADDADMLAGPPKQVPQPHLADRAAVGWQGSGVAVADAAAWAVDPKLAGVLPAEQGEPGGGAVPGWAAVQAPPCAAVGQHMKCAQLGAPCADRQLGRCPIDPDQQQAAAAPPAAGRDQALLQRTHLARPLDLGILSRLPAGRGLVAARRLLVGLDIVGPLPIGALSGCGFVAGVWLDSVHGTCSCSRFFRDSATLPAGWLDCKPYSVPFAQATARHPPSLRAILFVP